MKDNYYYTHTGKPGNAILLFIGSVNIAAEPFKELLPGDKISRVGNNSGVGAGLGMAALNRHALFYPYVTYRGIALIPIKSDGSKGKLIFFEIRPEDKPDHIKEPMYVAYEVLEKDDHVELKLWDHANNSIWVARPEFFKLGDQEKK